MCVCVFYYSRVRPHAEISLLQRRHAVLLLPSPAHTAQAFTTRRTHTDTHGRHAPPPSPSMRVEITCSLGGRIEDRGVVRDSNAGHQLLVLPPVTVCPMFASWTTKRLSGPRSMPPTTPPPTKAAAPSAPKEGPPVGRLDALLRSQSVSRGGRQSI